MKNPSRSDKSQIQCKKSRSRRAIVTSGRKIVKSGENRQNHIFVDDGGAAPGLRARPLTVLARSTRQAGWQNLDLTIFK
jgi:hypothetical protein